MHLIVGLGNPGSKYTFTRHNIGFLCVEHALELLEEKGVRVDDPKRDHDAAVWKIALNNEPVLFAEPQTFMNNSGEVVQPLMAYYKIPLENILIIQDDLDLPFQKLKFMKNRGAGGHNGIKNVTERLGTPNYARLKLGVGGSRFPGQAGADFVLQNFTQQEIDRMTEFLDRATEGVLSFVEKGYEKTANVFNQSNEATNESEEE